jgi:hypothetical protein
MGKITFFVMSYPRRLRYLTAVVAVFSLLFMQLAVAAYACPKLEAPQKAVMLDASGQPMANCPQADPQSPSLCEAHSNQLPQSLEKPPAPSVQPFMASGLAVYILPPDSLIPAEQPIPASFLHAAGAAPPLAIRHCCFRL